jgi:hypothetical protein
MSAHPAPPKYGDYPELFWDLKPEEPIDVEQPWVLARLLTTAAPDTIRRLAPISLIRREFPNLPLPDHTRRFWEMVFEAMDRRKPLGSPAGA